MPETTVHHLNCGTMCPRGERMLTGSGSLGGAARIVCHVLLIEGPDGLILVDTGFGTDDMRRPQSIARPFRMMMRPQFEVADTALEQLKARGFDPADVRHIVLTHLDIDHGGGLPDFPAAQVHVWEREHHTMLNPPRRERTRYTMARQHWAHGPQWVTHEPAGEEWRGFESVRVLPDSAAEILLIPLPGHSLGHTGVALNGPAGWLLHCGDAYFHPGDIEIPRRCPVGLRVFQSMVQADGKLRHQNQERLAELAQQHGDEVTIFCSHDPAALDRAQAGS